MTDPSAIPAGLDPVEHFEQLSREFENEFTQLETQISENRAAVNQAFREVDAALEDFANTTIEDADAAAENE